MSSTDSLSSSSLSASSSTSSSSSSSSAPSVRLGAGDTYKAVRDHCSSGSITPTGEARLKYIKHATKWLAALPEKLTEELKKESQALKYSEEEKEEWEEGLTKIGDLHRILSLELKHIIDIKKVIFKRHYQKDMRRLFDEPKIIPTGPLVKRFGIDPRRVSAAAFTDNAYTLPLNKLHCVEQVVFTCALEELDARPSTRDFGRGVIAEPIDDDDPKGKRLALESPTEKIEGETFAHNVVIVDIFVRDKDKLRLKKDEEPPENTADPTEINPEVVDIKVATTEASTTKSSVPEIHTVVLWKREEEGENTIFIIDPSNRTYSEHINEPLESIARQIGKELTFITAPIPNDVIYSTRKKPKGYSDSNDKHPKPRDCIDIAVKIAFEINEQQKRDPAANADTIRKRVFARISNLPMFYLSAEDSEIDEDIKPIESILFIRELQDSDKEVREEAISFLRDNWAQIKALEEFFKFTRVESASLSYIKDLLQIKLNMEGTKAATVIKAAKPTADDVIELICTIKDDPTTCSVEEIENLFAEIQDANEEMKKLQLKGFTLKQINMLRDPAFKEFFQIFCQTFSKTNAVHVRELFKTSLQNFEAKKPLEIEELKTQLTALEAEAKKKKEDSKKSK
jgi:hypothetical protein